LKPFALFLKNLSTSLAFENIISATRSNEKETIFSLLHMEHFRIIMCTKFTGLVVMKFRFKGLLGFLIFFLQSQITIAETDKRGVIAGVVLNSATQQPVANANLVVVGTSLGAASDLEGHFRIVGVPLGTNAVQATVLGYNPIIQTDIVVTAAKPVEIKFELIRTDIELEEVTVSTGFFQKSPDKPVSTTLQSAEEIRRLPGGFEDVVRAISILPGVAQVNAGRNDLIIRGGSPAENLYVADKLELSNINHFGTQGSSGGAQSYINLDYIDKTQFSTGGFGVKYGDKLSSVLSIDLREGRSDRIGGKATISATQFGLNLDGPINSNGSFIISARRSYLDFIFKAADFAFVPEYWDFLIKGSYAITPIDKLTILSIIALDRVRLFNETQDQRFDNSTLLAPSQNNAVGGLSWQHLIKDGFFVVTLDQSYIDYRTEQNDSLLNPIFRNKSYEIETSLNTDLTVQMTDRTELLLGFEGDVIQFQADVVLDTLLNSFGELLYTNSQYDTVTYKAAGYLQVTHNFDYLRWTVGLRLDYFGLLKKNTAFSPRLALSLPITTTSNLNVSVGQYHQSPSLIWLVSDEQNRNLDFIGVNQYIIGVDKLLHSDLKLALELYYKDYFDYPASELRPYLILVNSGVGWGGSEEGFASFGLDPLVSAGSGWSRGAELTVQKRFSQSPYYGIAALSYNEARFTALDGIERPSSFDQRWIINLGGGLVINKNWEFALKFRYATGVPFTPFNNDGTQNEEQYHSERTGANHSLDLRIDRRWYFDRWTLITYLDIQNVYNFESNEAPRWNAREGFAEDRENIGILPSIGLSVEF